MFTLLTGGCCSRHPNSFYLSREQGINHYVLLIIHTDIDLQIGQKHITSGPDHALLISPNTPYHYSNPNGEYMDDWIHFTYTEKKRPSDITIPENTLFPVSNPALYSTLTNQLLWEKSYPCSNFQDQNMDALFLVLFHHLQADYENHISLQSSPYQTQLRMIRLEIQNSISDTHTIARYAKRLNISESYFQHLYRELFGISFQRDLIQLRLNYAKILLNTSDLPINQIILQCGYQNEVHFYRQFKMITGITPMEYRRKITY